MIQPERNKYKYLNNLLTQTGVDPCTYNMEMHLDGVLKQDAIQNNFPEPHPLAEEERKEFDEMVGIEISTMRERHMAWKDLSPAQRERAIVMRRFRKEKQEAANMHRIILESKRPACWKWDKALKGRQFETLIFKSRFA